jgi:hypothetical protein
MRRIEISLTLTESSHRTVYEVQSLQALSEYDHLRNLPRYYNAKLIITATKFHVNIKNKKKVFCSSGACWYRERTVKLIHQSVR